MTVFDRDEQLQQWHDALAEEIEFGVEFRRELHQHPRVSGDELDTTKRFLNATDLAARTIADTGALARIGPSTGPAVGIRGELDALPVTEATDVSWQSTVSGAMHACGHDVHVAALAMVVRASKRVSLPYGLVAMLQPREETYPSGALDICRSGALDDLDVAVAVGAHVHPRVERGSVAIGGGAVNAAAGELEITFTGASGHGAYPHHGNDVVNAAATLTVQLPELVRRTIDPMHPALISVGRLIADGGAANVLPSSAQIHATMRTTSAADEALLADAVKRAAQAHAAALGLEVEAKYTQGEPVLLNDPQLASAAERVLPSFGLQAAEPMRSLGADDFSYYSDRSRSIMCFVGVGDADEQVRATQPSLHDATFLPDDEAVLRVAKAMVAGYIAGAELLTSAPTE